MALFNDFDEVDQDLGDWETYADDPDNKKPVRFRVRAIPASVSRRIEAQHFGRKSEVKYRGKDAVVTVDREKNVEVTLRKAMWALTGCQNFSGRVSDEGSARAYSELLGRAFAVGDVVVFDEHLTDQVKRRVLERQTDITGWILERAAAKGVQAREDEEESFREPA